MALGIVVLTPTLTGTASRPRSSPANLTPTTPTLRAPLHKTVRIRTTTWVTKENRKPGTTAWRIPSGIAHGVQGFSDHVSARDGESVRLFVSTSAKKFRVDAYRMGYYQGLGGRLVWRSALVRGLLQPSASIAPTTNTVECHWRPSLRFRIGRDWPTGEYLLKIVASDGSASYVPLTVADPQSHAALLIQSEVTTWQAYNAWGGYSLYAGPAGFGDRATVVSFDRPYASGRGAAGFFWTEQPLIYQAERMGLDLAYWTDVDLGEHPGLLMSHSALVSPGHDEYWSLAMRDAALHARANGVNIAFLGANADFRHIRLAASPLGRDRLEICYKIGTEDPLYGRNDNLVTSNWRAPPVPRVESVLNGGLYQCNPVKAAMVITQASSWLFKGTHLRNGKGLSNLIYPEYDRVDPSVPTPARIQILAHSPVVCGGIHDYADVSYYTTRSGSGVFDAGTEGWVLALTCGRLFSRSPCHHAVVTMTGNLLHLFASGPAGIRRPARPNLSALGIQLQDPIHP